MNPPKNISWLKFSSWINRRLCQVWLLFWHDTFIVDGEKIVPGISIRKSMQSENTGKKIIVQKMPITGAIQKSYALLGIDSNALNISNAFSVRSALAIIIYCLCVFSTSTYLMYEAETFGEYMDSVSITTATIIDTFTYLSFFCRLDKFSAFINSLEKTFCESNFSFPFYCTKIKHKTAIRY